MKKFLNGLWQIFRTFRNLVLNLVFISLFFIFVGVLASGGEEVTVPQDTALVLNLYGDIVEQKRFVDPTAAFLSEALGQQEENPEVLLADVLKVIDKASSDDRVKVLVLHLQNLRSAGLSKLQDIGHALTKFKASGKEVIALGDMYSQTQYYLASHADKVWLNPKGYLLLEGYGRYQLYFKSALEKLSISQHIFRVGTFKSAVEPYMRDDMSEEAKTANKAWLADLWNLYKQDVAAQRGFKVDHFDETLSGLIEKLEAANGSFAEYAYSNQWVDELLTREQMRDNMIELVGKNDEGNSFNQIGFESYLSVIDPVDFEEPKSGPKVGVVVAKGTILDGNKQPGTIGGDSTARLLRKARFNDDIKAVVLRVDSPGGSAYASEIIRQEIELLKAAGKPVIASMGSVAASGGYWISASADKIYASPTTITGSIGIFGMFMTFENSLSQLGVHTDGVGTTEMSGFGVTRPLSQGMADIFQLSINRGYQDFISLVATERNMSLEQVDSVAQGRVWSGAKAKELGLVDELGSLSNAIDAAAQLANLENFDIKIVEKELSPTDKMLQKFFGNAAQLYGQYGPVGQVSPASKLLNHLNEEMTRLDNFNDPQGVYSFCLTCDAF